jgi:hypothetical protein
VYRQPCAGFDPADDVPSVSPHLLLSSADLPAQGQVSVHVHTACFCVEVHLHGPVQVHVLVVKDSRVQLHDLVCILATGTCCGRAL